MKLFGRILVGIVAMVLAGLAVYGVGVVIKNNNDKNSSNDTNVTLSIQEARELVEKVYTACKGGESDSIAPAAVYEKKYVDEDNGTSEFIFGAVNKILKLTDAEKANVKYHDNESNKWYFISYELTKNGIKLDFFSDSDLNADKIVNLSIINCYYENNNKDTWAYTIADLRGGDGTYINHETEENFNQYFSWSEAHGIGTRTHRVSLEVTHVNQSYFESNQLKKDNVLGIQYSVLDSIKHEQFHKSYGEWQSTAGFDEVLTADEVEQIVARAQNHAKEIFVDGKVYDRNNYTEIKQ